MLRCCGEDSTHAVPAKEYISFVSRSNKKEKKLPTEIAITETTNLVPDDLNALAREESDLEATLPSPPDRLVGAWHVDHGDHVANLGKETLIWICPFHTK